MTPTPDYTRPHPAPHSLPLADIIKGAIDPREFYQRELQNTPTLVKNRKGFSQKVLCPFHQEEDPSFVVSLKTGAYRCFACDTAGGSVIDFIMAYDDRTFDEARAYLADQYRIEPGAAPAKPRAKGATQARAKTSPAPPRVIQEPAAPLAPIPGGALATRPKRHPTLGEPSGIWTYRDRDANPLALALRFDPPGKSKQFRPLSWSETDGWQWQDPPGPLPLYGLEDVMGATRADAPLLFCEGEKAADAASWLLPAMVTTTTMHGAQSPQRSDFAPVAGRHVLIWPDNDAAGTVYARKVGELARAAGAASVAVLDLASLAVDPRTGTPRQLPAKWDAADAKADGWTPEALTAAARWLPNDPAAPTGAADPDTAHAEEPGRNDVHDVHHVHRDPPAAADPDTAHAEESGRNDVHDVHHVHRDPPAAADPRDLGQAITIIQEAIACCKDNPGALAAAAFRAAVVLVRECAPEDWYRLRCAIKDAKPDGVLLADIDRQTRPAGAQADDSSTAEELVALVQDAAELFHATDGTCYATLDDSGPRLTFRLDTQAFSDWLGYRFYSETKGHGRPGRAANDAAIRTARTVLTGIARHDGDERAVHMRAARHEGAYYVDIGSESAGAVEVTRSGWRLVNRLPVNFWRPNTMRPLPMPIPGGDLALLWKYANIPEPARPLVLAWLLDAWRPETPFAVLELTGQQGTAKSSTQAKLRRCVDPNACDLRSAPKSVEDLFVSAGANWVASLNNLSHLNPQTQDALCNLATGGGFAGRTLFTNADETLIEAKRPVILNGIVPVVTAQDLTDRVIHVDLPELATYRTETAMDAEFESDAPHILGGLLDLFVATLRELPHVTLERSPRMADYAALGEALARAQGYPAGDFLRLYEANRRDSVARSLDASPVACAVRRLVEEHSPSSRLPAWNDTMGRLLERLNTYRDGSDAWPKSARGLGDALRRQRPALSHVGILVEIGRAGKHGVPVTIWAKPAADGEHGERRERRFGGFSLGAQDPNPDAEAL